MSGEVIAVTDESMVCTKMKMSVRLFIVVWIRVGCILKVTHLLLKLNDLKVL